MTAAFDCRNPFGFSSRITLVIDAAIILVVSVCDVLVRLCLRPTA